MVTWVTRVYVGVVAVYIGYILVVAGMHTVCECMR